MDSQAEYKNFYVTWYSRSLAFARKWVGESWEAENIVQEVFTKLYEHWPSLPEETNLTAYLFTSIKNRCLDFLRNRLRQRTAYLQDADLEYADRLNLRALDEFNVRFPGQEDIEMRINQALAALPERCRQIFVMNKLEGKKQQDIAQELGISINTVESQMAIAYRRLREELKDCLLLLLFISPII